MRIGPDRSPSIAFLLALLLCGCAHAPAPASAIVRLPPACAQQPFRLTIVGDSLARGWGASAPRNSFASLIYADVRQRHAETTMLNLGRPGATTDEIAATEVSHIPEGACVLVVIISGANDVQKLYTPHHFATSYTTLLQKVRARSPGAGIVVIGLADVSLSPRIPWYLKAIESWLARNGNRAMAAAAQKYGAAFVPLYDLSHREAYRSNSLLSSDGIHPNDKGYRIMANAARPSIEMVLRLPPAQSQAHLRRGRGYPPMPMS